MFLLRHWLATAFIIRYGVPYMTYDLFAMYLSHYHRFRVKGQDGYQQHSASTVYWFLQKDLLLVLHHIALLAVLLPITLVRRRGLEPGAELIPDQIGLLSTVNTADTGWTGSAHNIRQEDGGKTSANRSQVISLAHLTLHYSSFRLHQLGHLIT